MSDNNERNFRVLIVDDSPSNIKVLAGALEDKYTLTFAMNAEDALKMAATDPQPDIILLDVMMPEMDGFTACAYLKSVKATANIPVIFVTMIDDQMNESRGFKVGGADYITKPIKTERVCARVKVHLQLKQQREFLERLVASKTQDQETIRQEARRLLGQLRKDSRV